MRRVFIILQFLVLPLGAFSLPAAQQNPDSLLLELKKHSKEDTTRLRLFNELILSYAKVNVDSAQAFAEKAIALATKLNNQSGLADAICNKGWIYVSQRNYAKAIELYQKSIDVSEAA